MNAIPAILLVEDEANDARLIQQAFRIAEMENPLVMVETGQDAINYLKGEGIYAARDKYPLPGMILLDLKLPIRSGFEVLEWIRQQPELRYLIVIVFSSSSEKRDVRRAYELGANAYSVKPVRFNALIEWVRAIKLYWMNFNVFSEPEA